MDEILKSLPVAMADRIQHLEPVIFSGFFINIIISINIKTIGKKSMGFMVSEMVKMI
jgi:hypothetical protein